MGMKFDDIVRWTQLCEEHKNVAENENLGVSSPNPIETICGCEGCDKVADYYFDLTTL
jgi:hypothetical protein